MNDESDEVEEQWRTRWCVVIWVNSSLWHGGPAKPELTERPGVCRPPLLSTSTVTTLYYDDEQVLCPTRAATMSTSSS